MLGTVYIRLRFEPDHFVEASICDGTVETRCCCLNIVDGLSNLLGGIGFLMQAANAQTVIKWPYAGLISWLVVSREGPNVWLECLEFAEKPLLLPSGGWVPTEVFQRTAISFRLPFQDLVQHLMNEFDRLQQELGDSGYSEVWGYEFPHMQLAHLRAANTPQLF
jgi:hypothetical protein